MRLLLFFLILAFTLAGLSELAFAEDVYNFQFQKKPMQTPKPAPAAPVSSVVVEDDPVNRAGWLVGIGAGAKATTNGFDVTRGYSLIGGYRFSKYLGLDASVIFGKGTIDEDTHILASGGGRVTPLHLKFFDWDTLDFSILVGVLTGMRDSDHSKPRLALYIGYGAALNVSDRFLIAADIRAENGDINLFQTTFNAIYRF